MPADQVMREFYAGKLKSGSGQKVTKLSQAKAIAASYGKRGDMDKDTATKALSGEYDKKPDMKSMHTHEMTIRRGHEGGFIARHQMKDKEGMHHHEQPEYPIANLDALKKHVEQHMGDGSAGGMMQQAPEVSREDNE